MKILKTEIKVNLEPLTKEDRTKLFGFKEKHSKSCRIENLLIFSASPTLFFSDVKTFEEFKREVVEKVKELKSITRKKVYMPVIIPDNNYCFNGRIICNYFNNSKGYDYCELGFILPDSDKNGFCPKPKECRKLKTN